MPEFTYHTVTIFFTGCLFMALIYHFVLYTIQKNKLLLFYSAYLLSATVFIAERASLDFLYGQNADLNTSYYFNLVDEPIQMFMFFTYMLFAIEAIDFFSIKKKGIIIFLKFVLILTVVYALVHLLGISFHVFNKRPFLSFLLIRIILMLSLTYLLIAASKYIHGLFFKIIIVGSVIMFMGNFLAFISSVTDKYIIGIYGIMWTYIALVLDVICFSAALGYKARRDLIEKQATLNKLLLNEKQLKLQELQRINAIYEARDLDRSRIARDLHDEIGSTLSSIHIYSSVAEKMIHTDPEMTKKVLERINSNTRTVMENMNDIVWAMKTGDQNGIPLSNKIKNIGYELLEAKSINCQYDIESAADKVILDIDLRRNILLIIKESLNNIVKYSLASEVRLNVFILANKLHLVITDNGKGFDIENSKNGNGLQNINYRVKQCNGIVKFQSELNNGTKIISEFPIASISDAG